MELFERCIHLCNHIKTLTGVHTTLLNVPEKKFFSEPFKSYCNLKSNGCNAYITHLYGAYEAERWDGKYIYYCPRGLVFIATPPIEIGNVMEYCIITGPIIMSNSSEDAFEDCSINSESLDEIPRLTTAQARSLSEIICSAVSSFTLESLQTNLVSDNQSTILKMMYDISSKSDIGTYPIETERSFQEHIRTGDKDAAQQLLNELLVHIYHIAGNDLSLIKSRIRELLVLMSRAAIDGGADMDEIFNLCCKYEKDVDNFTSIEPLNRWISSILHKFISFVFDFNDIKHQNVIFKMTAYIKEHLSDKLSLDQVAEQVYLSKSYFCRIIKDELGCTFTEYVNRLRIERSKVLLLNTDMPISDIAYAVGFDDQSYFTRIFKKQLGIAPGKFREKTTLKTR